MFGCQNIQVNIAEGVHLCKEKVTVWLVRECSKPPDDPGVETFVWTGLFWMVGSCQMQQDAMEEIILLPLSSTGSDCSSLEYRRYFVQFNSKYRVLRVQGTERRNCGCVAGLESRQLLVVSAGQHEEEFWALGVHVRDRWRHVSSFISFLHP